MPRRREEIMIRLGILVLLPTLAVIGAGWAQGSRISPPPHYEDLLASVEQADCEKSEAADHLRFICGESRVVWYFTKEGEAAHPSYAVKPAWGMSNRMPTHGPQFGSGRARDASANARETFAARVEAFNDWQLRIDKVWRETQPRLQEDLKKLDRRLWPAE
jgi:hypothetical protein